jgi:1-acyl-sn-glycerol-3-phosphate acyltransferase
LYQIIRAIDEALVKLFIRRECVGLENFPNPPYILVTNHLSIFDTPLLLSVCPDTIRAFAALKHRRNPLYGTLLSAMGSIWVKRGAIDREALRQALNVLKRGEVLGMAPEGTRSRLTHALQQGKTGPAYLATRADVPLVPVGITGSECIAHNMSRLRRTPVRIDVGQPFCLPESGQVRSPKLKEYTELIMERIAELLPARYRGAYADQSPMTNDQ